MFFNCVFCVFPECVAKGSRLEVGVWGVADVCASRRSSASACVHGIALLPCRWAALTKCDPDAVLEVAFLANSVFLLRFVTCVAIARRFPVASATLCAGTFHIISWQALHFVTWRRCCFDESPWQDCTNMTQRQRQHFVSCLNGGANFKNHIFA